MLKNKDFNKNHIEWVINVIKSDKGRAAALRYADHPDLAYKSWDQFIKWGIDLQDEKEALIYTTVTASMARAKVTSNGNLNIGCALFLCYPNGESSGELKLHKLTGARDVRSVCKELSRILSLVSSRGHSVDYAGLITDLYSFGESVKKSWTIGFYKQKGDNES